MAYVPPSRRKLMYPLSLTEEENSEINTEEFPINLYKNPYHQQLKDPSFARTFFNNKLRLHNDKLTFFIEKLKPIPQIDFELCAENINKVNNKEYVRILSERKMLNIHKYKKKFLELIKNNQVILIHGDAGLENLTQVSQYILDDCINGGKGSMCRIVCIESKRFNIFSAAEIVAKERTESVGISCGYHHQIETKLPREYGSIVFVTTRFILSLMKFNTLLDGVSHLILDEIHSRSASLNLVLAIVKLIISKRKDIKIILMGATGNIESVKDYFNNCPDLEIVKDLYPVKTYYLEHILERLNYKFSTLPQDVYRSFTSYSIAKDFQYRVLSYINELEKSGKCSPSVAEELRKPQSEMLHLDLIYQLTLDLCKTEDHGSIIVYVTSVWIMMDLKSLFEKSENQDWRLLVLDPYLSVEKQKEVFEETLPGTRKIIITSYIADSYINFDDVVFVIDSGWEIFSRFNIKTRCLVFDHIYISKSIAEQRKNRAGQIGVGKCFRLYTEERFSTFTEYSKPSISKHTQVMNILLAKDIPELESCKDIFELFLDRPEISMIDYSIDYLKQINAIEGKEWRPLAYYLSKLQVDPHLGKILLYGTFFKCLDPILNITVTLEDQSIDVSHERSPEFVKLMNEFTSDHLFCNKLISLFEEEKSLQQELCDKLGLNFEGMQHIINAKQRLMEYLFEIGLVSTTYTKDVRWNSNSDNLRLLESIVCAGLYPKVVRLSEEENGTFYSLENRTIKIHWKSALFSKQLQPSTILAYHLKKKMSTTIYICDASIASPLGLYFFTDKKDTYIVFRSTPELESLKEKLGLFLSYKMVNPQSTDSSTLADEDRFLRVIVRLLSK